VSEYRLIKTYRAANWIAFAIGIALVWYASRNWLAMAGAWIASLHITRGKKHGVDFT
jgi:hypothetical protein